MKRGQVTRQSLHTSSWRNEDDEIVLVIDEQNRNGKILWFVLSRLDIKKQKKFFTSECMSAETD